jgi:hypothetical protein
VAAWAGATIAAKDHLAHARVLATSFAEHHPGVPFHVLLADEIDGRFDPAAEPYELVTLDDLGLADRTQLAFRYAKQPFSYAVTPALIDRLLDDHERVVFIKQESLVLGRLDPVLADLDCGDLVLTPHLLDPLEGPDRVERELGILVSGTYNGGIVGAGRGARPMLDWWAARTATHCLHDIDGGLHYEQRWLDLVPTLFGGVRVLRDPAVNVGHWNLREREVRTGPGGVTVRGEPCRLFRFSGHRPEGPDRITRYNDRDAMTAIGDAAAVFARFDALLWSHGHAEVSAWPYAYGAFADGVAIPEIAREIYRELPDPAAYGDPFAVGPGTFRDAIARPRTASTRVPWIVEGLLGLRPDVRAAYPDPLGEGADGVMGWFASSGAREHDVAPELVRPEP